MQKVRHRIFGVGEVIARESNENGTYITARFGNGKEMRFAIPDSFTLGIMVAEGSLKEEVDAAIAEKKARERARLEQLNATSAVVAASTPSNRHGRTPAARIAVKGPVETAFEKYLISAGYSEYSAAGNRSTVYAYTRAIKKVLKEKGFPGIPCRAILIISYPFMISAVSNSIWVKTATTPLSTRSSASESLLIPNLQTTVDR